MTNCVSLGVSVHLFLPRGTADGVRIAQIPGWTGSIACAPAAAADQLAVRPESEMAGLHLFVGSTAEGPETMVRMRISSNLQTSLRGPYWAPHIVQLRHVVVITDRDDMLTGPELHWLGYLMQGDIGQMGARSIVNDDIASGIPISEVGRAQVERFMERVRIVLPILSVF